MKRRPGFEWFKPNEPVVRLNNTATDRKARSSTLLFVAAGGSGSLNVNDNSAVRCEPR